MIYVIGGAAVVALGAWLRWAVLPVLAAFRAGLAVGRLTESERRNLR